MPNENQLASISIPPKVFIFPALALVLLIAILPNGIEYSLLAFPIGNEIQLLPLYLAACVCIFLPRSRLGSRFYPVAFFAYLFIITASSAMANNNGGMFDKIFSWFCYVAPLFSVKFSSYLVKQEALARRYYMTIFVVLVAQGCVVLLQTAVPFLDGMSYLSGGAEHRESFGYYRFGSTLAAANTSGCLTALALAAILKVVRTPKGISTAYCTAALAILGYQSRSGFLMFVVLLLWEFKNKINLRTIILFASIAGLWIALLAFRDSDELGSSSDYRALLALQALSAVSSADIVQLFFGYGPGTGFVRDMASYYGQVSSDFDVLLSSSESFLLLSLVEIGVVGTSVLLILLWENTRNIAVFALIVIYLILDPSFSRVFESFLVISLAIGAAASRNSLIVGDARRLIDRAVILQRERLASKV